MSKHLYLGNIATMNVDAIVNAAATDLKRCPGICGAIFSAADAKALEAACRKIGHCDIGKAVVTPGCGLYAKYIIHVAGAGWYGGLQRERFLLGNCYHQALNKALFYNCKSVALPLIFSGDCHIPRAESIKIAGQVIADYAKRHKEMEIYLVLYKPSIYNMAEALLKWPKESC